MRRVPASRSNDPSVPAQGKQMDSPDDLTCSFCGAVTHQGLSEHDRDWWVAADYPEYRFPAHAAEHEDTPEQARRDIEWWREHRVTHPDPLNDSPRGEG